jgi:1-deoxy-D-xylulose-5-phosphate synthase
MPEWRTPFEEIQIGKGRKVREGKDVAILTIGHPGNFAVDACETLAAQGINAAHFDMRFVKPIDEDMLHDVFSRFSAVITVEDGCIQGGFGSAVIEFMADHGYTAKIKRLGIPDKWIEHGEQPQLWKECGFDTDAIVKTAVELVSKRKPVTA